MSDLILAINAGSSSLKFAAYRRRQSVAPDMILSGQLSGIGGAQPEFRVRDVQGAITDKRSISAGKCGDLADAQHILAEWLADRLDQTPMAVGHRIVHGGSRMCCSVLIDDEVLGYLESLIPLAPLHQKNNLAPVQALRERWAEVPQVACFDTVFHRTQDAVVERFALPQRYYDEGVKRYGFHGLSYEFIAEALRERVPDVARGRVIALHIGAGVSACAMENGVSRETTMGFTALDGLPMATRPGRLDPGVVLWMLQHGMSHDEIQDLLYNQCGLKGLSGISGDTRVLLSSDDPDAQLAIEYFAYRAAESVAGLGVAIGGVDAIVFTAGVGENSPDIRMKICQHLSWLGVSLDAAANGSNAFEIAAADSRVRAYVLPTNEEMMIARHTCEALRHGA